MSDACAQPDAATVLAWREEGLSLAEIGHRLGVSPDRLRELLASQGVDLARLETPEDDDDTPNTAASR